MYIYISGDIPSTQCSERRKRCVPFFSALAGDVTVEAHSP